MDLKTTRVSKRRTQFDVAVATGISQSQISYFERGLVDPNRDERHKLAAALGVKAYEIDWTVDREKAS